MNGVRKTPKIRYVYLLYQITKKYNHLQAQKVRSSAGIPRWLLVIRRRTFVIGGRVHPASATDQGLINE